MNNDFVDAASTIIKKLVESMFNDGSNMCSQGFETIKKEIDISRKSVSSNGNTIMMPENVVEQPVFPMDSLHGSHGLCELSIGLHILVWIICT